MATPLVGTTPGARRHLHVRHYVLIWVALLALTGLTLGLHYAPLGRFSLAVALAIAFGKSTLVVMYFMHLREEHGASRISVALAVFFVAVIVLFVQLDVKNRFPLAVQREEQAVPTEWRPDRFTSPADPDGTQDRPRREAPPAARGPQAPAIPEAP